MTEPLAIHTQGLIKSYGRIQALFGVELEVKRGTIAGFLGPNGAGKTTTIRCLLDMIRPNGGTIKVAGINPQTDPVTVRSMVGYLPGELHLDDNMTAESALRFYNALRKKQAKWDYVEQLVDRFDLDIKRPIKNLSSGNKKKVGVIQALMHRPEILMLDEPTGGLDPLMQREVLRLIKEARADGATVFFSSHNIAEVEAVADHVNIIREGIVVEVVDVAELLTRALRHARITFREPVEITALTQLPGVSLLSQDNHSTAELQITGDMDTLIKALGNYPVVDMQTTRPSLESIFMTYYETEREEAN
ncbi:MAG: ABC transporter ATP-binding protein [Anaerolineales bacterium]|jgi:ABC-2 type transport system ATP-binding protein